MSKINNNFNYLYMFKRLISTNNLSSSSTQLNQKIKHLIDGKKYNEALDIFEENIQNCSHYTISIAINACSIINDYQRAMNIKKKIPSISFKDSYIQTSLIKLYSELWILSIRI